MPKVWEEYQYTLQSGEVIQCRRQVIYCGTCLNRDIKREGDERYSLGIFAGYYCSKCWDDAGYRKEGPEGYNYLDAGEYYEDQY